MKAKLPYAQALEIACGCVADLAPYCERIEIAGSLRRRKAEIGDIEVVAIPKLVEAGTDLFGNPGPQRSLLEEHCRSYQLGRNGPNYKQLVLASIDIDLFITTPAQWGVIFTLRTGSADFSHWLVTHRQQGGALPGYMTVKDGRVWAGGKALLTPEEADFFRVIGLVMPAPEERVEGRWNGRRPAQSSSRDEK